MYSLRKKPDCIAYTTCQLPPAASSRVFLVLHSITARTCVFHLQTLQRSAMTHGSQNAMPSGRSLRNVALIFSNEHAYKQTTNWHKGCKLKDRNIQLQQLYQKNILLLRIQESPCQMADKEATLLDSGHEGHGRNCKLLLLSSSVQHLGCTERHLQQNECVVYRQQRQTPNCISDVGRI